jgi:hypothetical protein
MPSEVLLSDHTHHLSPHLRFPREYVQETQSHVAEMAGAAKKSEQFHRSLQVRPRVSCACPHFIGWCAPQLMCASEDVGQPIGPPSLQSIAHVMTSAASQSSTYGSVDIRFSAPISIRQYIADSGADGVGRGSERYACARCGPGQPGIEHIYTPPIPCTYPSW